MSEPGKQPTSEAAGQPAAATPPPNSSTTTNAPKKPESKGFTNPALQMMGVKSIKLPSRNWMIFWTALATLSGGIFYDKYQQKQLRAHYMEKAKPFGDELNFKMNLTPRKLRIYVVPPPNDYLGESLRYLRRFTKPILNSAAIDFEIYTETRQGDIRAAVAEEIRRLRRAKLGLPDVKPDETAIAEGSANELDNEKKKNWLAPVSFKTVEPEPIPDEEKTIAVKDLYKPSDVLGITYFTKDKDPSEKKLVKEDSLVASPQEAGGIICLGRGAFKEYMNGVHEGLLGPLYKPENPPKEQSKIEDTTSTTVDEHAEKKQDERINVGEDDEDADETKMDEVPKPYIQPSEYSNFPLAPELDLQNGRDAQGVPYFFLQPILVLRNYNVAGFTRQPERLYRFYNKRKQQIEYNNSLWGLINKNHRPFKRDDLEWAQDEEGDWPSRWVKTSTEKGSEWCREFKGDERVINVLSVFEKIEDQQTTTAQQVDAVVSPNSK